jgi:F0F1-type ATP synthase assembly protein I
VKLHRAITLVLMIAASLALLVAMTAYGVSTFGGGSLVALVLVVAVAAIAGIGFSYRRYFPRRR